MNKGLEVIEAHYLFDLPLEKIEVVIHPQSIVHSLVEYVDGAALAQMSHPDMKLPIQYALTYPRRVPGGLRSLDLIGLRKLEFHAPDVKRFPCLRLAYDAARRGGTFPAVLNAANEAASAAFLAGKLRFLQIPEIIGKVMRRHRPRGPMDLKAVLEADAWARREAEGLIQKTGKPNLK